MNCSIIVPVYNHWHLVPTLLDCLAQQTLPQDEFETILIENASDAFEPPESLPPNTTIITCDTPGSYAARNRGIKKARGPWLVFTDADCRPRPDWLENLIGATNQSTHSSGSGLQAAMPEPERSHRDPSLAPTEDRQNNQTIYAGAVQMVPSTDTPNRYEIYDLVRGIPQDWYVKRGYAATANLAVPAELMKRLNGFHEQRLSGGDAELCRRARQVGANLQYLPDAVVDHPARNNWPELTAKARRIKAGQIAAGDWKRRFRSLFPPVIEIWRCLRVTTRPFKHRLTAVIVQLALWPVELRAALQRGRPNPLRYNSEIGK